MENASKALIIAGAILLSILIISLGIMIFNQAQDAMSKGGMSEAEISAFNNKFIKYQGSGKKASEIRNLVQEVNVSNAQEENAQNQRTVTIQGDGIGGDIANGFTSNGLLNSHTYTVNIDTYVGGRVSIITIVQN